MTVVYLFCMCPGWSFPPSTYLLPAESREKHLNEDNPISCVYVCMYVCICQGTYRFPYEQQQWDASMLAAWHLHLPDQQHPHLLVWAPFLLLALLPYYSRRWERLSRGCMTIAMLPSSLGWRRSIYSRCIHTYMVLHCVLTYISYHIIHTCMAVSGTSADQPIEKKRHSCSWRGSQLAMRG